ncbi:MAG: hypothetical protein HGA96_02150 [Desulfobulbaceae bacterium]|nr:hypothetical protein [Desulfobulbaceae bacterium]
MKNGKILIIGILVGLGLLLGYLKMRHGHLKKIQAELETTQSQRNDLLAADREVAELVKRYGAGADVPAFVEQMHRYSRQLGLAADYELSSSQKNLGGGRRSGGASPGATGSSLTISRMRVAMAGEYRDIAEYLRLLQADKSPKKIIDLKIVQEKGVPKLNLNLELYSYRGGNGA